MIGVRLRRATGPRASGRQPGRGDPCRVQLESPATTGGATAAPTTAGAESPIAHPAGFPIGTWTTTITADDLVTDGHR